MSDTLTGCLYVVAVVVILGAILFMGGGYLLDQLEAVKRAEAVVAEQKTIQQKDYYAFMAAMAAMGQVRQSVPWWVWLLLIVDVALGIFAVSTRRR